MTKNNINKMVEKESKQAPIYKDQIINKSLKLETVNEGGNEDDVLVRGTDKTVKFVPRSEFGGGGSQTLQDVVDNNPNLNEESQIFIGDSDGTYGTYIGYTGISSATKVPTLTGSFLFADHFISYENSQVTGGLETYKSVFGLSYSDNTGTGRDNVVSELVPHTGTTNTRFHFPENNDGLNVDLVLATEDKITLQTTLNNNGYAEFNGGYDTLNMFNGGDKAFDVVMDDPDLDKSSQFRIRPENIDIINDSDSGFSQIQLANGGFSVVKNNGGTSTTLSFSNPSSVSTVNIPSPPLGGNYTLATTDDLNLQSVLNATGGAVGTLPPTSPFAISGAGNVGYLAFSSNVFNTLAVLDTDASVTSQVSSSASNILLEAKKTITWGGRLELSENNVRLSRQAGINRAINVEIETPTTPSITYKFKDRTSGGIYDIASTQDLPLMTTLNGAPSSATATGTKGEIRIDDNYFYMCIATNTWKRSPLSTW